LQEGSYLSHAKLDVASKSTLYAVNAAYVPATASFAMISPAVLRQELRHMLPVEIQRKAYFKVRVCM
jgi:hypothetical protein